MADQQSQTQRRGGGGRIQRRNRDQRSGESRTFSYLGPGPVEIDVNMRGLEQMADGRRIQTWQFGRGFNDDRSVPGPVIEGIEGQLVEVTLRSQMPHTIHFHGLDVDQAVTDIDAGGRGVRDDTAQRACKSLGAAGDQASPDEISVEPSSCAHADR